MPYTNTVKQPISDARYADEHWRAHHGYKEVHQHDPPMRRNRDFKPVPWGAAVGMPNYRHSEPFLMLKNLKDLKNESANHPIRWIKQMSFGALVGFCVGQCWTVVSPTNAFALQKLQANVGERDWSGRLGR